MFGRAWRLGRIAGIQIRIDPSWTVIALLIAYSLFLQFTLTYRGLTDATGIALAVGAMLLFFGSVLAHEMTHAMFARRAGIPVGDITLFIFGGSTHANVESRGPGAEFAVSVVGPLSSVVLAGSFWIASILGHGVLPHPVEGALGYLGWVNLLLAGFNLLPGFPLDGGRVLRSAVWGATGDFGKATRVATLAGEAIGYLLIAGGVFLVFGGEVISGIWSAAIGWFLAQSARSSYVEYTVREAMRSVDVDAVMEHGVVSLAAGTPIQIAVDNYLMRSDQGVFPVEQDGSVIGFVTADMVRTLPREEWATSSVRDVMLPLDRVIVVTPSTPMKMALDRMEQETRPFLLVVDDSRAVGLLTIADVAGWLRRRDALAA